ncbi:MAG: AEC family transporter [Clostridia bacterium]|nr:AEC family transporter [Clostridia bacterium]
MEGLLVIIEKIAYIGIMILIGFLCEKTGFVKNITNSVSGIIKNITLPCLLLTSLISNTLDASKAKNGALIVGIGLCAIVFMMFMGNVWGKMLKLDDGKRGIQIAMGSFGNVAFLGYPLIQALLGPEGLLYAVFYNLINDGLLWSFGLSAISGEKGLKKLKNMLNICTLSFAVGLVMLILGLKLPAVLQDSLASVGSATTPLSMLFIGATMARADVVSALKRPAVYLLTFTKMVFMPLVIVGLMALFLKGTMNITAMLTLVLQVAMPAQTMVAILAKEYDLDSKYAVEVIFITTVFALVSLPVIYQFAMNVLG